MTIKQVRQRIHRRLRVEISAGVTEAVAQARDTVHEGAASVGARGAATLGARARRRRAAVEEQCVTDMGAVHAAKGYAAASRLEGI